MQHLNNVLNNLLPSNMINTAAEKDKVQQGWDDMSNESIVKDVATKGKYINLAIAYLAKRLNVPTITDAKAFFRIEINKYVERLLSNKQVFKAEHVLSNVNVSPIFYFHEFYETCENSEVRCAIVNFLKKTLGDEYEREHLQMTIELKALKVVNNDEMLRPKYGNCSTLEQFKELDLKAQKELLADVCFTCKCEFVIEELNKHVTWNYLLQRQLFVLMFRWIDSIGTNATAVAASVGNWIESLRKKFSAWDIDDEMIDQITVQNVVLPDFILNSLAKKTLYVMKTEQVNIELLVKRLISSESLNQKGQMLLSTRPHSMDIVKSILDRNLNRFLMEEFVDVNDLIDVTPLYPQHQDEVELCIHLKKAAQSSVVDTSTISAEITKYLVKKDPSYRNDHNLVNLADMLLQEESCYSLDANTPNDFDDNDDDDNRMLNTILRKFHVGGVQQNDFLVTLNDLVKRFEFVDLHSIKSNAGDEDLNFCNTSLFQVCVLRVSFLK